MYIARKNSQNKLQSVKNHCENTAKLACEFSIEDLKDLIYNIALLHDIGKYQNEFQEKITNNPNLQVSHALCGAKEAHGIFDNNYINRMMQFCIAGHHVGLQDAGTCGDSEHDISLCATLKKPCSDYSAYKKELSLKPMQLEKINAYINQNIMSKDEAVQKFAFITRYCFSCLTDADSLDSAAFEDDEIRQTLHSDFEKCLSKLNAVFDGFEPITQLQKARSNIQSQVFSKIDEQADIFLMDMPTGSGKTLCSLKFALERAIKQGKKRIIYVIPYNSIIDQTAKIIEDVFGDDVTLLRHQSTFDFENEYDEQASYKLKNAAENWGADFIITTAVQFFESVHGNKRGKLRRVHNLENSILIFDEAHLMPLEYLMPCLTCIAHITTCLNSEAVFLTATMPNFSRLLNGFSGVKFCDLVQDKSQFEKFDKCTYEYKKFADTDSLVQHSLDKKSTLIVCNTKGTVKEVFEKISGEKYHLSTNMTAFDREKTIAEIRLKLSDNQQITVVSTSLIEAGVDLDFDTVYRQISGLDNILQAAGRCNREGLKQNAVVYMFELPNTVAPKMEQGITQGIIKRYPNILDGIDEYYAVLHSSKKDEIAKHTIKQEGDDLWQIPFRSYTESFRLISDYHVSIVVPRDEKSRQLIELMKKTKVPKQRKLQKYVCSISKYEFDELLKQHCINDFGTGMFCLTNEVYYDEQTGIKLTGQDYFI